MFTALLFGCGGAAQPVQIEETSIVLQDGADDNPSSDRAIVDQTTSSPTTTTETDSPTTSNSAIRREALSRLLNRGPAALLAQVITEPHRANGRFVGFRITDFKVSVPTFLDLKRGDIIVAINGLKIVMPDDYFRVFNELKVASEIRFEMVRDGHTLERVYPIVDSN